MTPIYRWNGQHFGFIQNGNLFNLSSQHLGSVTNDGKVWTNNGSFLGEVVDNQYILRNSSSAQPAARAAQARPASPARPATMARMAAKASRAGYIDALDEF